MALSDNLVGLWSPWLGSSGYRLIDRVRLNNGTLTNMDAGADWVGATVRGRSGYALDFDGSNDRAELTRTLSLSSASFSISMWANQNSGGIGMPIGDRTSTSSYVWLRTGNYIRFATPSGTVEFTGVTAFTGWNHLVITGTSSSSSLSSIDLYWNGIRQTPISVLNGTFTMNTIGDGYTSQAFPFPGRIAEVAAWSTGITRSEALELFRLGPGWYQPCRQKRYAFVGGAAGFRAYWSRRQSQLIGGGL